MRKRPSTRDRQCGSRRVKLAPLHQPPSRPLALCRGRARTGQVASDVGVVLPVIPALCNLPFRHGSGGRLSTTMSTLLLLSTTMSTNPTRDFSLSRAFGSLADTRHCAIGSHTPSTTMSTTPPMDSDLTHIKGPKRLTKRELRLLD